MRLLATTLLFFSGPALAKSYSLAKIEQDVFILEDSTVRVEDTREFVFEGQFKRAFLDIKPHAGGTIKYLGVEALDGKGNTNPSINGTRITWDSPANNEHREFKISYVLTKELQTAKDATLFDRRVIEDTHAPVGSYVLRLHVPKPAANRNHRLFMFSSYNRIAKIVFDAGGKLATVSMQPLRENETVRAKAILTTPIGKTTIGSNMFETWLDQTASETKKFRDASQQASQGSGNASPVPPTTITKPPAPTPFWLFVLPFAALAFLLERLAWVYQKFGREPKVQDIGRYFREPAEDIPPGVVPFVLHQAGTSSKEASHAIAATLLDFARRGLVELQHQDKRTFFGTTNQLSFKLIKAPEPDRPVFEQELWKALKATQYNYSSVSAESLKNYSQTVNGLANTWAEYPRQWYEEHKGTLLETNTPIWAYGLAILTIAIGVGTFVLGNVFIGSSTVGALSSSMFLGGATLIAAGIITIMAMPRWKPEKLLNANKWLAYKSFLTDFSQLEKAPPEHYKLWDYHFVYAAALGVADRYLANIGQLMRQDPTRFGYAGWMGYNNYGNNSVGTLQDMSNQLSMVNSLQDITRNLNDLQSSLNAQEARSESGWSGGSGGSSMGGSSGGGGSSGAE